jgi:hypothetical protein
MPDPLAHLRPPGPPAPAWLYIVTAVLLIVVVLMVV